MEKLFIIDYDDTCAPNIHDYSFPQLWFAEYVINELGPKAPEVPVIIKTFERIDKESVGEMKFIQERFPLSFIKTFRELCKPLGVVPTVEQIATSYEIGMQAFNTAHYNEQGLLPRVAETLDFLLEKRDDLILLTKGDLRVQSSKIIATDIGNWFKKIIVVEEMTAGLMKPYANIEGVRTYRVGNSWKSDVLPALEAGIRAIYIPLETWAWEKEHAGARDDQNVLTLQKFEYIKDIYDFL